MEHSRCCLARAVLFAFGPCVERVSAVSCSWPVSCHQQLMARGKIRRGGNDYGFFLIGVAR